MVDEIGPIASPLQGPVQSVPPQPHQPTTNRRPGHHATRCATTEKAEDGRQDPWSGAKRQLDGRHQVNRQGDAPDGPGPRNAGAPRREVAHRGSLPIGVAPNTEDSARDDRAGRQRPHGLTDALFRSGQRPLFSVPCGAVRGADNWANSCPRCSERSGNFCDCDSTIDCVASAEQVLASLARAARATCPAIAPQQPLGCATACNPSGVCDTCAHSLLRLVNNDRTRIRCGVFASSACSKIGDAPIASASLPGAQSSRETFDKQNKKPWLRQAENVTSRPTSHQPTSRVHVRFRLPSLPHLGQGAFLGAQGTGIKTIVGASVPMLASFLKRDLRNLIPRDASPNFQDQNGLLLLRSWWRSVRSLKKGEVIAGPFPCHARAAQVWRAE